MELFKLDATIRACDESLLSRDGYHRLAAIEPQLIREHQVAIQRIEITNIMNEKIRIRTFNTDE
ncbi:7448_t:CDS:1, partial [Cetraspora pellucida]